MPARLVAALLLTAACAALAAPLPFPRPKKKPSLAGAMQGLWEVKSRRQSKGNSFVLATQHYVRVQGTTWTFLRADRTVPGGACEMKLDTDQKPAALDLAYPTRPGVTNPLSGTGPYMVGRVEVDGDVMRFCYSLRTDRPASLSPSTTREWLFTLHRVKAKP